MQYIKSISISRSSRIVSVLWNNEQYSFGVKPYHFYEPLLENTYILEAGVHKVPYRTCDLEIKFQYTSVTASITPAVSTLWDACKLSDPDMLLSVFISSCSSYNKISPYVIICDIVHSDNHTFSERNSFLLTANPRVFHYIHISGADPELEHNGGVKSLH